MGVIMAQTERQAAAEEVVLLSFDHTTSIAKICLNRPHCLNAINVTLLNAFVSCLRKVQALDCKICILSGSGTSFCSGEDLKETLAPQSNGRDPDELRRAFHQLQSITRLMTGAGTIFIAAVNGWAVGGGAEIALAADVVVASPDAKFKLPEIIHGHAPTGGITGRLPQLIGLQKAKWLMLFGDSITASEALTMNMVTEVSNDPVSRSGELAMQLSQKSGRSLASIKRGLEKATFPNLEAVLDLEVKAASWCFADECASDAFKKFRNRKSGKPTVGDTLPSLLQKASFSYPDRPFLRFGSVDITYANFAENVNYLASGLLNAGVQKGDVVGAMMVNSEVMIRFWFAAISIGAIWAPLHTEFRGVTLRRALELITPKIMIIDETYLSYLPTGTKFPLYVKGTSNAHESWTTLIGSSRSAPIQQSARTTSSLLFTSGTTGPSKACELSHEYFLSVGQALIDALCLTPGDVLYCPFPLCHADATSLTVVPALLLGATAAISERFSASRWWDEIRETRATVADFMGATLSILFKAPARPTDADNTLRMMWGVPVPVWVEDFERRFGLKIFEVYGSTETGLPVVQPVDRPRLEGSCGVALKGIELRIINEDGSAAQPGKAGELLVRQPAVTRFSGYYKNADATEKSLHGGWFYSGDLCRLDSGENLFFIGRKKHVIRRRGENISAFEVEEALLIHPDILECAAYGVPAPEFTEEDLVTSIIRRPESRITENDVHDFAVKTMAKFQVPRYIGFLESLPRTPTGKLEVFKLQNSWARGERDAIKDFEKGTRAE
ncbi:acetyl-CoA synthetase-like protein [Phellopilus nigrolimitatus]|nr:acetyl-CoA synthetase-like protein [Phellopilus nigrolimitatus]